MSTFTLAGTSLDAKNNPAYVGRYMVFRVTSVGSDTSGGASYPRESVDMLIAADGTFSGDLWVNGDSGIECLYEVIEPSGQRIEFIFPSSVDGTTVRYEFALENYLSSASAAQQTPALATHIADQGNPHVVTPSQLGLIIGTDVQAYDSTILVDADISSTVQAYNSILDTVETTITDIDTAVPTSGAVVDYVTAASSSSQVIVTQASDLSGTLDPTKTYFIDGIIDMGSTSIEVPSGGLSLTGSTFDISKLISSAETYTMFTSPVGGSGNLLGRDLAMEVTAPGSQVFNLVSVTGFEAFEFARVNWNDCTSLGTIDNYRQGLESGTGRFGGTPNLTLKGAWVGGYFIGTSIVRSLDAGMTGALYQAGVGFTMASRFRSNQNIDLPASAAFIDFTTSNFTNPSTLQLEGCIISRGGTSDSTDPNITPNVAASDLASNWVGNIGIGNTFVGGRLTVATDTPTVINTIDVFETIIATTWTADLLEHFDDLAIDTDGRGLRHLGNVPRYYEISGDLVVDGPPNDEVTVKVMKYDSSATTTVDIYSQTRQINSITGTRDVAFFSIPSVIELDQNDYVYLEISNSTSTGNLTLEGGSVFSVKKR